MDTSAFKAAVNSGLDNLVKLRKNKNPATPTTFFTVNSDQEVIELLVDVYPRRFNCDEWETFMSIQWDNTVEPAVRRCSKYVAGVIVGAHDDKGVPLFDESHIALLDDPLNAMVTINLATEIFLASELTSSSRAEKKLD